MESRSTKELLIILRDNLERVFKQDPNTGGMCSVIHRLHSILNHNRLSIEERNNLLLYLSENKPKNAQIREKRFHEDYDPHGFHLSAHWWKPRAVKPRIDWLNKQIEKL